MGTADKNIKIVLFDLDGVLIRPELRNESGLNELVKHLEAFVKMLKSKGMFSGLITAGFENKFTILLDDIGFDFIETASINKADRAQRILGVTKLDYSNLLYIGDEIIDIPLLQKAAIAVVPKGTRREVKRYAHIVTESSHPVEILKELTRLLN